MVENLDLIIRFIHSYNFFYDYFTNANSLTVTFMSTNSWPRAKKPYNIFDLVLKQKMNLEGVVPKIYKLEFQ